MKGLFALRGKTAVVTGGAGLLGRALAEGLGRQEATVYVADVDERKALEASKRLRKKGLKVQAILLDIRDEASIVRCLKEIIRSEGRMDIWVNNAYPRTSDWSLPLEKIPSVSWKENIDAHLNGYCLCCQKAAEIMRKQRSGSLINMASIYGSLGPDFTVYEGTSMTMPAAYSAIKGGVVNFTRYLASYYGKYGVRVNSVSPGGVLDGQPRRFVRNYCLRTPLGRLAKPADVVGAVIYLASEASGYVTGQNLVVDGGWSIV